MGNERPNNQAPEDASRSARGNRQVTQVEELPGAGNGGRTRDIHLGKVALYH
jgi:hypothetical protein